MKNVVRFKMLVWRLANGKPSKIHMVHEGKVICSASSGKREEIPVIDVSLCRDCLRRARWLQGRNPWTGQSMKPKNPPPLAITEDRTIEQLRKDGDL